MSSTTYDVIVVGSGPGGYVAAIRAAQLGLKTACVEREHLGGVCLNWGCIPTKVLLRNAEVVNLLGRGDEFGFTLDAAPKLNYGGGQKRSRQVADRLSKGVGFLFRKYKVDAIEGTGKLRSATEVEVGGAVYKATKGIIIATGARARSLPGLTVDGKKVVTYRHALALTDAPKRIVIVGAGPIGLEFAYVFRGFGAEVTVLEMLPRIAPLEDEEISAELEKQLKKLKIQFHTGAKVSSVDTAGDGVTVKYSGKEGDQSIAADMVLVAIGVQPNSEDIGLETVGVKTEKGWIHVDGHLRTNVPGVYAIGDVTGKMPLAHVGSKQGMVAAETIAGHETAPIENYLMMPRCIYTIPQVASYGLTEAQAKEKGHEIRVGKFPMIALGKALALGEREGFVKLISDAKYGEILGAHLIGPDVTELLPELALAQTWELTPHEIARTVHAHPTLSEALGEVAHMAEEGRAINI